MATAAEIKLSTTGTLSSVVVGDFGNRTFAHPVTGFNLLEEFTQDEIRSSEELQDFLDAGHITLEDQSGAPILDVSLIGGGGSSPSSLDKDLVALETLSDGEKAVGSGISVTPALNSHVAILVNGLGASVGDGIKTKECYFSGNNGVDARLIKDIVETDTLHWNGSKALYQLATDDKIDFVFND